MNEQRVEEETRDGVQQCLEELDALLQQEVQTYQALLARQQQEKQHLVTWSLTTFVANLQAKETLVSHLATLEKARQEVITRLASLLALSPESLTLQTLSTRVDKAWSQKLLRYRTELQDLIQAFTRCNQENALLLRDALDFVNGALAFFRQIRVDQGPYSASGQFATPQQGRFLSGRI
ncbi:MAG: flagellar protein FlgN [Nitrospinota bacterium]|nr:MAG: flagellar protein FlgN [Nitrospinota bacterium]